MTSDPLKEWLARLAARHTENFTVSELRRAVQSLSSIYVERRGKLLEGAALTSAGKRAAFAHYYGPLHFLLVREVVLALRAHRGPPPASILDLGCGTGVAGAAWGLSCEPPARVFGVDRHPWAVEEARWTLRTLGLRGEAHRSRLERVSLSRFEAIVVAFAANEIAESAREGLRDRLLDAARRGARVLVVEPLARRVVKWWGDWSDAFLTAGGRNDAWRFPVDLPEPVKTLDKAAGLDHRELTARSLYLPGGNL